MTYIKAITRKYHEVTSLSDLNEYINNIKDKEDWHTEELMFDLTAHLNAVKSHLLNLMNKLPLMENINYVLVCTSIFPGGVTISLNFTPERYMFRFDVSTRGTFIRESDGNVFNYTLPPLNLKAHDASAVLSSIYSDMHTDVNIRDLNYCKGNQSIIRKYGEGELDITRTLIIYGEDYIIK